MLTSPEQLHTAQPRGPFDNPATYRDAEADAEALPALRKRMKAPTTEEVAAAFRASFLDLANEFSTDDTQRAAARLALRVARDLAEPGDRKALDILVRADAPRTRCAYGSESCAWEVRELADELRAVADQWDDEAERVIGEAA